MADTIVPASQTRLGRMLRLYRAHRDITIRDLAREIGTSAATLVQGADTPPPVTDGVPRGTAYVTIASIS